MDGSDPERSRAQSEAPKASLPEDDPASGDRRLATTMLVGAASCAVAVGLLAAVLGFALPDSPTSLVVIIIVFAVLIGILLAAWAIARRARRAHADR
jgi:Fe2+ transport system protein B